MGIGWLVGRPQGSVMARGQARASVEFSRAQAGHAILPDSPKRGIQDNGRWAKVRELAHQPMAGIVVLFYNISLFYINFNSRTSFDFLQISNLDA